MIMVPFSSSAKKRKRRVEDEQARVTAADSRQSLPFGESSSRVVRLSKRGTEPKLTTELTVSDNDGKVNTHEADASSVSPPTTTCTSFESLPEEIFYQLLSYLGPTSSALVRLAQTNRRYRHTMQVVGDSMLVRASAAERGRFGANRCILPKMTLMTTSESSTSVFVRYARRCKRVNDMLGELGAILDGGLVVKPHHGGVVSSVPSSSNSSSALSVANQAAEAIDDGRHSGYCKTTADDIDRALDLALNLMGIVSNTMGGCSASLERRVLALAGKCGGKIFQHTKARMALRTVIEEGPIQEGNYLAVQGEDHDDQQDAKSALLQANNDEVRLDKSRLLMQQVVFHRLLAGRNLRKHVVM